MALFALGACGETSTAPTNSRTVIRVASNSLCADQYVLALADPEQIVSLTWQAEGALSAYAAQAEGYPVNRGAAEEFIASDTDVVILNAWGAPELRRALQRFEIDFVEIPLTEEFDTIEATVMEIAYAIGQEARGEALLADMRAHLAKADSLQRQDPVAPDMIYFRPEGGGAGAGTFVDTAMKRAGLVNVARKYGVSGWGRVPLENLVLNPPEGVITSFFDTADASLSNRFGSHPLYRRLSHEKPVIAVPGKLWLCSSPLVAEATALLADARLAHFGDKP